MKTIIEYYNKYYLAERVSAECKDKCKNCPLNSECADEDGNELNDLEDNNKTLNDYCKKHKLL